MPKTANTIKIIRSTRRRKTVQARLINGIIEVRAPAAMTDAELEPHINRLTERLLRRQQGRALENDSLEQRARLLNKRYFKGSLVWQSIRWVTNQNGRFGSCTPAEGTIRISHRVGAMPDFVLDYVLVHELAHLVEANHGEAFWDLVRPYPRTERAIGYLMAVGMHQEDMEKEHAEDLVV